MKNFIVNIFLIVVTSEVVGKKNLNSTQHEQTFKVHVRLKGSSLSYAGRVEISKDGEDWGTICDKEWDLNDARVICRQLDYSSVEAAVPMAGFGAGSGSIFLKDVDCKGNEQSLLQCSHDGWKSHDVNGSCDHSRDAGVLCSPPKQMFTLLVIIVLGCAMGVSYLLNVWFTYYICCRTRRRRKRHLTAVQQKELSRKKISQGLENFALDNEEGKNLSTPVSQENQVVRPNGIHPPRWSARVCGEDAPTSNAASHEEQQQHVYQRLESCVFDPPSQDYLEILESLDHRPTNQQPAVRASVKSPKPSSYQPLSQQLQEETQSNHTGNDEKEGNLYEKLLLRNQAPDETQASSAKKDSRENGNTNERTSIPEYVEIISDEVFARITMATPTSAAQRVDSNNAYEALKPSPDPARQKEDKESACVAESKQTVRAEDADYVEPWDGNEANVKDNAFFNETITYEPMLGEITSSSQTSASIATSSS